MGDFEGFGFRLAEVTRRPPAPIPAEVERASIRPAGEATPVAPVVLGRAVGWPRRPAGPSGEPRAVEGYLARTQLVLLQGLRRLNPRADLLHYPLRRWAGQRRRSERAEWGQNRPAPTLAALALGLGRKATPVSHHQRRTPGPLALAIAPTGCQQAAFGHIARSDPTDQGNQQPSAGVVVQPPTQRVFLGTHEPAALPRLEGAANRAILPIRWPARAPSGMLRRRPLLP